MITIALAVVVLMVLSRGLKMESIRMERMFVQNLRSRDIEAQVRGRKRPLYEGHLLDRDVHMADLDIPAASTWAGKSLRELELRNRFGVHVSSILRANRRLNIPDGHSVVFPGDRLQVIGSDEQLSALAKAMRQEVYGDDADMEKRETKLRQMVVTAGSPLLGKTLRESGIRDVYGCLVVGIEEGKENLSQPDPSRTFALGDVVWIVGEDDALARLMHNDG